MHRSAVDVGVVVVVVAAAVVGCGLRLLLMFSVVFSCAFRHVSRLSRHAARQRSERLPKRAVELKPKMLQSLCQVGVSSPLLLFMFLSQLCVY